MRHVGNESAPPAAQGQHVIAVVPVALLLHDLKEGPALPGMRTLPYCAVAIHGPGLWLLSLVAGRG